MRIAVFPGTFDPITLGHLDVIARASRLFDRVIVAIGVNAGKQPLFDLTTRKNWIQSACAGFGNVQVEDYSGLTVHFCIEKKAGFIVRGIRNVGDFEYEKGIADVNNRMHPDVETVFLACDSALSAISSTIVRDVIRHGGAYQMLVPDVVRWPLENEMEKK